MSDHLEIEITDAVILDVTARVLSSFDEIHSMSKRFFDGVVDGISQIYIFVYIVELIH